jgi:hypothetical protein
VPCYSKSKPQTSNKTRDLSTRLCLTHITSTFADLLVVRHGAKLEDRHATSFRKTTYSVKASYDTKLTKSSCSQPLIVVTLLLQQQSVVPNVRLGFREISLILFFGRYKGQVSFLPCFGCHQRSNLTDHHVCHVLPIDGHQLVSR